MTKEKEIDPIASKCEKLKSQHNLKAVYDIQVEGDEGQDFVAYVRKPNIDELGAFISLGQSNPVRASRILFESIFLEGDRAIFDDEGAFLGVMGVLDELVKVKVARITKR